MAKNVDVICRTHNTNLPIHNVNVQVFKNDSLVAQSYTDSLGLLKIKLFPGKYKIVATRAGYQQKIFGLFTIKPEGIDYIRLRLHKTIASVGE